MTYSDIRTRARENLRDHWGISVCAAFVAAIFGALLTSSGVNLNIDTEAMHSLPESLVAVLGLILSTVSAISLLHLILGGVVQLGYSRFLLAQHDGKEYSVRDLFSQFDRFSVGFLQLFLRNLFAILWSLLLIIPGIVKSYSYAMTPFILTDHPELTANQAIRRSMEMMDGHKGELFILGLTFIGWDILNAFTLGIGSLWLNPYKNAAYAAFYRQLLAERRETTVEFL
ncbi:MAG: DUF975 family protein [Oscillospiraceae bacterium]|nr:DUF975 family protein [Oscillospiraceae bacterium]